MEWTRAERPQRRDLAEEFGAVWEGDELVTYDMASLVWQAEHMSDDYMYDDD